MAPPSSPRKTIPLSGGPLAQTRSDLGPGSSPSSITTRAFFCAVVVEGNGAKDLPQDVKDLAASLGEHLPKPPSMPQIEFPTSATHEISKPDPQALADIINEFIATERSYVSKLRTLHKSYAEPLRNFARKKESALLHAYEANTLFGNIDAIVQVNEAFLADVEKYGRTKLGDVALKHFRDLKAFDCYKLYYSKREEAQAIYERESRKPGSRFLEYADKVKYSSDEKNRIGLRELLMEPIQRIPRYTLLWRTMTKCMALSDPQRAKLIEADAIASRIALCEADEQTRRASVMFCLSHAIEGFPPKLISSNRNFIDCIDIEDHDCDDIAHASLFLFDDILIVAKRHNSLYGGKVLANLDAMDKMGGSLPSVASVKRGSMSFKGSVDLIDVTATIIGPSTSTIHFYFTTIPAFESAYSDKWTKPFRALELVHPPRPPAFDPLATERDRRRFVENLWVAQARLRERHGRSILLCRSEEDLEDRKGRVERARVYWNVYERKAYLSEPRKPKVVVHIDSLGTADPVPFGSDGAPPFVIMRVQPLAGDVCRFLVDSTDPQDAGENEIEHTVRVPSRLVRTIHEYGLYKFKTGLSGSQPSTPSSIRSRAAIFGLDALALSRSLFNVRANTSRGDIFSPNGSLGSGRGSHRRTKSVQSKASNTSTNTEFKFSSRSNSTATAATTCTTDSVPGTSKIPRKLLRSRPISPGPGLTSGSEADESPSRNRKRSRSHDLAFDSGYEGDATDDERTGRRLDGTVDPSERDLLMRLELASELARKNSLTQPVSSDSPRNRTMLYTPPIEDTIYETDEPPNSMLRPASRASQQSKESGNSRLTVSNDSSRSNSQGSDRRPMGPRAPSPRRPRSPRSPNSELAPEEPGGEENIPPPETPRRWNMPLDRSSRKPLESRGNTVDDTPRATENATTPKRPMSAIEPLSIKKKNSVREASPPPSRSKSKTNDEDNGREPPVKRSRSLREASAAPETEISPVTETEKRLVDDLIAIAENTRVDIQSSMRAVKKIKLEVANYRGNDEGDGVHTQNLVKSDIEARMEEMRQLIGMRNGGQGTPTKRRGGTPSASPSKQSSTALDGLVTGAEQSLGKVLGAHETMQQCLDIFAQKWRQRAAEIEQARVEIQSSKRQCELLKRLLSDATTEKEILFEAFNEELDMMYNDAHLPPDEAWKAMVKDLRGTKEERNTLTLENAEMKRKIARLETQNQERQELLRANGLTL